MKSTYYQVLGNTLLEFTRYWPEDYIGKHKDKMNARGIFDNPTSAIDFAIAELQKRREKLYTEIETLDNDIVNLTLDARYEER